MWQEAGRLLQSSCANVTSRVTKWLLQKSLASRNGRYILRRATRDDEKFPGLAQGGHPGAWTLVFREAGPPPPAPP